MSIFMIGIDHNMAPVDVRAQFAFTRKNTGEALRRLKEEAGICGCIILSTCNRLELWVSTADCEAAGYLCWKKYHGDLFFPLSDHDRTQRPASSQHPADAECLGAFRSILGACADPWKQAGIFPLRRGTEPAYIYSVQT